jgi:hypothetical protein
MRGTSAERSPAVRNEEAVPCMFVYLYTQGWSRFASSLLKVQVKDPCGPESRPAAPSGSAAQAPALGLAHASKLPFRLSFSYGFTNVTS